MSQNEPILTNQTISPVIPGGLKPTHEIIEVSSPLNISFNLNDPVVLKLLEQGGFVVLLLVLCLFFWVLTGFVKAVKKE